MIVQCDFDGTITMNNLSVLLRENFAPGSWREVEKDYVNRRLGVEESNRRQYATVGESRQTLMEFARKHAQFRPGFLKFIEDCGTAGIRFVIVSSGLDFYIEAALGKVGAPDLEIYCAQTSFDRGGVRVTYLDPEGNSIEEGFKKRYQTWLKKQDGPLVYIGDGLSDFEAARAADCVFATDHLARLLGATSVPHHTFADFADIWQQILRLKST